MAVALGNLAFDLSDLNTEVVAVFGKAMLDLSGFTAANSS